MKKNSFLILVSFFWLVASSQVEIDRLFEQSPELILKFKVQNKNQLDTLSRILSIDKVIDNEVIAFAIREEFEHFLSFNIPFDLVGKPALKPEDLNMKEFEDIKKKSRNDWNYYPTYEAYLSLMNEFETNYPDLCRVVEFGTTVKKRKLLACVISANVHVREQEPQVFWTSSMHGDETCGYILMLRFIDYLLSNYSTDERIKYLLDHIEIWVNPLANPDGTYWTGNSSVSGSRRYNANSVDLNRNYKDWVYGDHPDGKDWQLETLAFMELQDRETFVLGANIHGGEEVCNYPWDNTYSYHADDLWWQLVCREYADTAHLYNSNYLNGFNNGIVRGCDWYRISGGRQDYANYYRHHREFTLEISSTWTTPAAQLPTYWNYNFRSFLNYTQQALYGVQGTVTDLCSGNPLPAKIFVNEHDKDNSFVMTDPRTGYYVRPCKAGTYSITYSANGYESQTVTVTVSDQEKVVQNIELRSLDFTGFPFPDFEASETEIFQNETVQFTDLSENATQWEWFFKGGTPEKSNEQHPNILYKRAGRFNVSLSVINNGCRDEILKQDYITVNRVPEYPVADFEADNTEIFQNEFVKFTNLSTNASVWDWFFEGAIPETSVEQNPIVLYGNPGVFSVKLTASNSNGSDETIKNHFITVRELKIKEIEKNIVSVFPNPVSQQSILTIETELPVYKIEWINRLGIVVKTEYPEHPPYFFPVSDIGRGFYILKIESLKGVYSTKIQIQ